MLGVMASPTKLVRLRRVQQSRETVAAGAETKRPDTKVASDLRLAPPGLEPGLS
jgi:hypothetical protein